MLTHDVEPIIDTVKSLSDKFKNQTSASFLKLSSGHITECSIEKDDIQTFTKICKNALASTKDDVIKAIYLRRYFEIVDHRSDAYQVLSNIFHKGNGRERGVDKREPRDSEGTYPEMDPAKFAGGCTEISSLLDGFSYSSLVTRFTDLNALRALYIASANGYEKLQVFRLLGLDAGNSVIQKFINETYHIENEFICQLDPAKFDTIPEYVISECDKVLEQTETAIGSESIAEAA
jgi:hypothetical protein